GIEGHLGFDALFRFSPFSFVVQISAGVSLKAFGVGVFSIDLNFTLEGPAPWRAHGRGSITLLFFEISADFDITWGEERTTTLPPVAVLALLEAEVRKTEGWQTRLPAGGTNPLVTLRPLTPDDGLVLHPLGSLFVRQRAIPLGVRIDRVGAQRPSDGKRFTVEPAPGSGLVRRSVTGDKFAMAQFQDMDDAAKLSRPAYETQDAGLELVAEGGAIASPRVVRRSARYELSIVDNKAPGMVNTRRAAAAPVRNGRVHGRLYTPPATVFNQLLEGSSTARSPLSQQEARQRQPFAVEETVRVPGGRFVVAYLRNNQQAFPPATASATSSSFRSVASAEDAMADWIHADPALAGQLHVLRQAEVPGGTLAESGVWSVAGAPPSAVTEADAVRLSKDGQVLVAGGADATGTAVATTALFDPIPRTWAPQVGSLATARRRHTATRLGDGRVVAAGGLGTDGAPLATVEVFDPVTRTWSTPDAALTTARYGHSATIADRKLLVAGGTSARGAALALAELLDPATLAWTAIGPMAEARTGHAAVVLGTGAVLVVGGAVPTGDGERALASCELYDPATKSWTATGSLATPRKGHQATLLPGGKVLVTGGDAVPAIPYRVESLASAEVYDPSTGVWQPVDDLPGGGRSGHRCVRTRRGAVVIGGVGRPRATAGYRDAVTFNPATGSWTPTGALATGRWDFAAVDLADGRVLAVGGRALTGPAAPGPAQLATTAETYLP
ncbi:kelch repeat-containing protein, partial [Actinophytocola sp.]|uniref:kelch repeat-containing protein n=1 Tax=Actinophytocola sp. TaxID=1872138 RepID=UPI003899BD74